MNHLKLLIVIGLIGLSSALAAAEPTDKPDAKMQRVTDLLSSRLGGAQVARVEETPVDGIYQTRFGSKFAYLSSDGRYVFVGDLIDLQSQTNLTEESRRGIARQALDAFDVNDLTVFPAQGTTKTVLNVFTDTSCPYCRKLHEEVPELQKAGIEVRYFPFPRGGARGPGYAELKQVWCGENRQVTMDIVKGVSVGDLPKGDCENADVVDRGYTLGNEIGVEGTPALFTSSGVKIEGYVPYAKLIPMLLSPAN